MCIVLRVQLTRDQVKIDTFLRWIITTIEKRHQRWKNRKQKHQYLLFISFSLRRYKKSSEIRRNWPFSWVFSPSCQHLPFQILSFLISSSLISNFLSESWRLSCKVFMQPSLSKFEIHAGCIFISFSFFFLDWKSLEKKLNSRAPFSFSFLFSFEYWHVVYRLLSPSFAS